MRGRILKWKEGLGIRKGKGEKGTGERVKASGVRPRV
jgi:hypothetical protein